MLDAGYEFEVDPSEIDEPAPLPGMDASFYAADLAWRKAVSVALRRRAGLVLAADTVGSVDGLILNKPVDRADAERMIRLQEGRESDVLTAVCLIRADRREWVGAVETSVVKFRKLEHDEREAFLDSNHWQGKAGAYGLQDHDPFISIASGSYSNIVGLPMERLEALFREHPGLTS